MKFEFGGGSPPSIMEALRQVAVNSDTLSIAVSYVQVSGWELLKSAIAGSKVKNLRLLCTDQLGITDPNAVRAILNSGASVHAFTGKAVFHPKVFIGSRASSADQFLLGSANLSRSALMTGIEADCAGEDPKGELLEWFNSYFDDVSRSVPFDKERLEALDIAFAARAKSRLLFKHALQTKAKPSPTYKDDAENAEIMESVFASLKPGVTPLNFDKAGNNVRQIGMIRGLLQSPMPLIGKAKSEMKLIGLVNKDGVLTPLGQNAAKASSNEEFALVWMTWLRTVDEKVLNQVSPSGQLKRARQAFERFWELPNEVTDFFIANCSKPAPNNKFLRRKLQTIELVANAGRTPPALTLDDIEILSRLLDDTSGLTIGASEAIRKYTNKGNRGWKYPDRKLAVTAFREAPS